MSAEFLALYAGSILSLLFSYVPGLSTWFDGLKSEVKRLVMLGLLLVVAVGVVALACAGYASDLGLSITCDRPGIAAVAQAFILALIANQATYQITPKA